MDKICGPLEGIRIVDMTLMLLGPYATQILADLGAEVIKVEPPKGDGRRTQGPSRHPLMTSQFLHVNRGKRSIAVDLKHPEGRKVLLRLCKTADVLVHSSRRQAMERLKLTYDDVAEVNPKIVYCGAVGFGQGGLYADMPSYDDVIQGLTAIPSLQSCLTGSPNYLPLNLPDRNCGLSFANVILAALLYRERTGEGQAVELPMFETMAEYVLSDHMWGRTFEPPVGQMGSARLFNRRPAKTKDGYICFIVGTDKQCADLFDTIAKPELKEDSRFRTRVELNKNLGDFYRLVENELVKKTTAEWVEALTRSDVPAMPLHALESLMDDPHLREVGFFKTVDHPTEGKVVSMAVPSRWSKSIPKNTRHAPHLGENTREILFEVGFSASDIEKLVKSKAVISA